MVEKAFVKMGGAFYSTSFSKLLKWAQSRSLWYFSTGSSCCADEVLSSMGCRYDMERFGCLPQHDPRQSDLLIVCGIVSHKSAPHLKQLYEAMLSPKWVLAIGACANGGGAFSPQFSYSVVPGVEQVIPVDVYIPGCPPRPEAIMNGLMALQDKICG